MSEAEIMAAVDRPATVESLAADLWQLGVCEGMTLIVHSSLKNLGWVCGGPQAVIMALQQVLTPKGTLLMPAHSGHNSNSANWQHPPVPKEWVPIIREHQPAFDPTMTQTRGMGEIADLFWRGQDVIRGDHPSNGFAAWGADAATLVNNHRPADVFSDKSPIGRVYARNGHVLLLGVAHNRNTTLHLSEHKANWPGKEWVNQGAAVLVDGQRQWVEWQDFHGYSERFIELARAFEDINEGKIIHGKVASAECQLMQSRPLVDFGTPYMEAHWGGDNRTTLS